LYYLFLFEGTVKFRLRSLSRTKKFENKLLQYLYSSIYAVERVENNL